MTNQEILQALNTAKKGQYIKLTKVKNLSDGIKKVSRMVIRLGVNYANLSINENRQTGSLPWGHWIEGLENLVIEHKGNYYLRITSKDPEHPEASADVIETKYFQDENEITKAQVIASIGEEKSFASPVYNIKFENILAIGER